MRSFFFLVSAILVAACQPAPEQPAPEQSPPVQLELRVSPAPMIEGDAIRGEVILRNLTDESVVVTLPGLPEFYVQLLDSSSGEVVYHTCCVVLYMVWSYELAPHESLLLSQYIGHEFLEPGNGSFSSVPPAPGCYLVRLQMHTHDWGTIYSNEVELEVVSSGSGTLRSGLGCPAR